MESLNEQHNSITTYYSGIIQSPENFSEIFEYLVERQLPYVEIQRLYYGLDNFKESVVDNLLPVATFENLTISDQQYIDDSWDKITTSANEFIEIMDQMVQQYSSERLRNFREYFRTEILKCYNKNKFFSQHIGKLIAEMIKIVSNINQNIIVPYEKSTFNNVTKKISFYDGMLKAIGWNTTKEEKTPQDKPINTYKLDISKNKKKKKKNTPQNETTQNETPQNETTQNETTQNETTHKTTENETTQFNVFQYELFA